MSKLSLSVAKSAAAPETTITTEGVDYGPVGLSLSEGLPFESWEALGRTLGRMERSVMWWMGDWWRYGERRYGERAAQAADSDTFAFQTWRDAGWVAGAVETSRRRDVLSWSHHREVAALPPAEQDYWLDTAASERLSVHELRRRVRTPVIEPVDPPVGQYRCIVIDPPWPMDKIEREVRPNQGPVLDYPTMTLDEIGDLPIGELAVADGCHVYLWVTHRFLPDGLRLFERWGVDYQCVMTWNKNVGITPFSWMYDTEHVLFGRVGSLRLEQLGLRLSFSAPVTKHSAKPDAFYERVVTASPGPRLEMFARTPRDGFTVWGNEVAA